MSWEGYIVPSEDGRMRTPCLAWNDIQGRGHEYKGKIRQKWGLLSNEDIDLIGGYYEELSGRIQELYNLSKEDADKEIQDWLMGREDTSNIDNAENPNSPI